MLCNLCLPVTVFPEGLVFWRQNTSIFRWKSSFLEQSLELFLALTFILTARSSISRRNMEGTSLTFVVTISLYLEVHVLTVNSQRFCCRLHKVSYRADRPNMTASIITYGGLKIEFLPHMLMLPRHPEPQRNCDGYQTLLAKNKKRLNKIRGFLIIRT